MKFLNVPVQTPGLYDVVSASGTTTTLNQVLRSTATPGVGAWGALVSADLPVCGRCLLTFQNSSSVALTTTAFYLKNGEIRLTATKGIVMDRACTVEGMSANADITTGGGFAPAVKVAVYQNGSEIASVSFPTNSNGTDLKISNTTSGSAALAAGDILSVVMVMTGTKSPNATVVNMLAMVELKF